MRILKYIFLILIALVAWTAFLFFGMSNGFLLSSINEEDSAKSFIESTKVNPDEEFVGSRAMALIQDGKIEDEYYYSIDQPVDRTTVFPVASISKWVTAWGVMKLVEQGKLDLDVPVDSYLTRWHLHKSDFDNKQITIRRLLSHSSGVIRDIEDDNFKPETNTQTIEELLNSYEGDSFIWFEPGSQYAYSNIGYAILQLVIEEVTQQSFPDYIEQTVFEPLQMNNSTFLLRSKPDLKLGQLYDEDSNLTQPNTHTALAAAGLFTSVEDLSKLMQATISDNVVLSQATKDLMNAPQTYVNDVPVYGLGPDLYSQSDEDSKVIGHDGVGGVTAMNTAARIDLNSKDGIIILQMGNYYTASGIAEEWLFWKFGIADFKVIQRNKSFLLSLLIIGYLVIGAAAFGLIRRSKRRRLAE
ncbi:serine hydrolase domain-containing protein [Nonlabens antarcticus]|uniref:serine hydrolase domain-containing protein n=1 Tax=Nonlabens antarcticus TaxID=392714 RepID=UPI0018911DAE|nr:serine hydrolase domain-containing protein [Nonlabens antarcticus]